MRTKTGVVVSAKKMAKTIVVLVETKEMHPIYRKPVSKRKKYLVHDEKEQFNENDKVTFYETRPLSRRKRWTTDKPENLTS